MKKILTLLIILTAIFLIPQAHALPEDMTCQYDNKPYLTSKISFICTIPAPNVNESFNCVTYVRKENATLLLQSNPEYADPTTLQFWKESERRHAFTSTGRIINAYYTDKLLEINQEFIIGMTCTSAESSFTSEYTITPTYKTPTLFVNRLAWANDNWAFIIISIVSIFLLIIIIAWARKKLLG